MKTIAEISETNGTAQSKTFTEYLRLGFAHTIPATNLHASLDKLSY